MSESVPACAVELHLQVETDLAGIPTAPFFETCSRHALAGRRAAAELTVRIVDRDEARTLNLRWRGIDAPTNVLSFPMNGVTDVAPDWLGDIAICAPLVRDEADAQGKRIEAHWAHLVVHGILHLIGFAHETSAEADVMEQEERTILAAMGYPDPYVR